MDGLGPDDIGHVIGTLLVGGAATYAILKLRHAKERPRFLMPALWLLPIAAVGAMVFATAPALHEPLGSDGPEIAELLVALGTASALGLVAVHRIPLESRELRESIAALRDTNELLDGILDNVPAGVLRVDADGVMQYGNRELLRITGMAPGRSLPNLAVGASPLITGDAELAAGLERALRGEPIGPFVRDAQIGGRQLSLEATSIPIRAANGGTPMVTGVLFFVRDITKEREAASEAEQARAQMLHSERLATIGTLLANVAHEINNPLQSMVIALHMDDVLLREIEKSADSASLRASIEKLRRSQALVQHGVDAIEQLSKSLKGIARTGSTPRKDADPNAIVRGVESLVHARLKHTVEIVTELHATRHVQVNEAEISQVLLNLAINAGDALGDWNGPRKLTLRTSDRGEGVLVEVADTGPGIPPDVSAKLFTPFFTTKPGGTGLGLSISRRLVEQHGSHLAFVTEAGKGTTFSFMLPAAPFADAASPPSQAQADNASQ